MVIEDLAQAREIARLGKFDEAQSHIQTARARLGSTDAPDAETAAMLELIEHVEFYIDFAYGTNP